MIWADVRYFKPREFDSPDSPGSGSKMSMDFVEKLDLLRERTKMPLKIRSGHRTPAHNARVGGVDSSAHETGHAVDIVAQSGATRFKIVSEALCIGFRRIGIGKTFVHLDDDLTKPQDVMWVYEND